MEVNLSSVRLLQIAEMKESFGDDVDVLFVVSRVQYSRVLTTVKGTEGAAQQFLASEAHTITGIKNMQCMIQDAWGLALDQYYNTKGGRIGKKSGKYDENHWCMLMSCDRVHTGGRSRACRLMDLMFRTTTAQCMPFSARWRRTSLWVSSRRGTSRFQDTGVCFFLSAAPTGFIVLCVVPFLWQLTVCLL